MGCCTNAQWKALVGRGLLSADALAALPAEKRSPAPATGTIDTILLDGTFLLADPTVPGETVTAVALSGGTIVDVGDATRILGEAPGATQVKLNGATLAPGFIEAHAHIISSVQLTYSTNLTYTSYPTYDAVIAAITTAVASAQAGGAAPGALPWLFFVNFDPSLLGFTAGVGFQQLGFSAFAGIPGQENVNIFVENASGHIAYANATAFTTAGITASSKAPDGGWYDVVNGKLTGVMFEPPSFTKFLNHAPKTSLAQAVKAMTGFLSIAQQAGITTVADPAVGIGGNLPAELVLYDYLASSGSRRTDVVGSLDCTCVYSPGGGGPGLGSVTPPSAPGGTGSYKDLVIPAVKVWTDGSNQGYTGFMTEAYLPPVTPAGLSPTGEADWSATDLASLLQQAQAQNWSTLLHANGDAAVAMALTAFQAAYGSKPTAFRNRIEHCTVTTEAQYDTMQSLGVTPTYLNNHIYIWGDTFNDNILGNERASRLDAAGDAVARNMIFSFHCDYLTSMPGPLRYMQTAVTRTTSGGTVLGSQYAITALEALQGVTIYPAMQLGISSSVGTITKGKLANFVQLAANPLTAAPAAIASIQIQGTWLRGNWMPISP
jgi:predicted amidohydrolase YtcJ